MVDLCSEILSLNFHFSVDVVVKVMNSGNLFLSICYIISLLIVICCYYL